MPSHNLTDRRVLVTGGAGFLGRHIVNVLAQKGHKDVFVVRSKDYNLLDRSATRRLLETLKPTDIIHAAGTVGGIGANRENPGRFFYENLVMGVQLMEEARLYGIRKFVTIGTICSYPKFTPVPFKETDLWNGYPEETNAPYGIAKKALLVMGQAYRAQYGMNAIFLMPVNMYGPGDNFDPASSHIIPAILLKCLEAKERGEREIVCWGDGSPTREFLYVEDAAQGIVQALENYAAPEPVNLGTVMEISIREVTEMIARLTGFSGNIRWDPSKPNGQPRRCVDTTLAAKLFGFKAATSLENGLKKTLGWYLKCKPKTCHSTTTK